MNAAAIIQQEAAVRNGGASFPAQDRGFRAWRRAFAEAVRWPWFERCTDGSPAQPIAQPEPFESLKSFAASGAKGCVAARQRLKAATNRGLAAALGRDLPRALAK